MNADVINSSNLVCSRIHPLGVNTIPRSSVDSVVSVAIITFYFSRFTFYLSLPYLLALFD